MKDVSLKLKAGQRAQAVVRKLIVLTPHPAELGVGMAAILSACVLPVISSGEPCLKCHTWA